MLTADEQAVIRQYRSPANEGSVVKQVPIAEAEYLRALVKRASPGQLAQEDGADLLQKSHT